VEDIIDLHLNAVELNDLCQIIAFVCNDPELHWAQSFIETLRSLTKKLDALEESHKQLVNVVERINSI
jgi:hypothetical protein